MVILLAPVIIRVATALEVGFVAPMILAALICGKISALFILENFQDWKKEGNWGDIKFLIDHDKDIEKIAVVGDEQWRDFVYAFLAKGFRQAQVEYFLPADLAKARVWLGANTP